MDHDGRAAVTEDRMRTVGPGHVFAFGARAGFAVGSNGDVGVVAGVVTFRIFQAMLLPVRIEMRSGGLEVGAFALGVLMEVDGVLTGREIFEMEFHSHSVAGPQSDCA